MSSNEFLNQLLGLDEQEEQKILYDFNSTAVPYPENKTVIDLFEEQVLKASGKEALLYNQERLSYRELNQRVNQMAHYLRKAGVTEESMVPVCMKRSTCLIISILGILKAGGAYVPVDVSLPLERKTYILDDCESQFLLVDDTSVGVLSGFSGKVINVSSTEEEISLEQKENPQWRVDPDQLSYMIYTSGTSGKPKGVMIEHKGLTNLALAQISTFGIHATDKTLQFANVSFDASVSEIFVSLVSGSTLVLADDEVIKDKERFLAYGRQNGVTVITLPPSYLALYGPGDLDFLRVLITAGEAAKQEAVDYYAGRLNYFNAYGPTECTVCVSVQKLEAGQPTVSIGKPINNTNVFILNDQLQPVSIGVAGELCVAGIGVSKGYWNKPELTNEKFINNLYGEGRLYKTGDLARWLPDGQIEFLGRKDDQVKIRGHRVELEEIKRTIEACPGVEDAAVVFEDSTNTGLLSAYFKERRQIELWPSVAEFFIYDDLLYHSMYSHESRNDKYRQALDKVIQGKKVLEIGPGPEAVLSRLCIDCGADHVYAVEILEETYQKAKAKVSELGLTDKITIIRGDILETQLDIDFDYCVSEIVGSIGGSEGSALLIDKIKPMLKNPANMIPKRSATKMAVAYVDQSTYEFGFLGTPYSYAEEIASLYGDQFEFRLCLKNFKKECILSTEGMLEDLDYSAGLEVEKEHDVVFQIESDGLFTGFIAWMDLFLDEEVHLDVMEDQGSWLPVYFPVSVEGYPVSCGDIVKSKITRSLSSNGVNPNYFIKSTLFRKNGEEISFELHSYHHKEVVTGNTFYNRLLSSWREKQLTQLNETTLKDYLAEKLPEYMIPAHIQSLDHIPLTSNGKVDKTLLPAVTETSKETYEAPLSDTEVKLVEIWQEVLGKDLVGVHDNFFEMGGDSIIGMQMVFQAREAGMKLEVTDVFEHKTIAELAIKVLPVNAEPVIIQSEAGPSVISPIQHRFFKEPRKQPEFYNQTLLLKVPEDISREVLKESFAAVYNHHDALRATFSKQGDSWQQQDSAFVSEIPFHVEELTDFGESLLKRSQYWQGSLNLQEGPLTQMVLFLCQGEGRLLWSIHHLVVDGFSWRILLEDLNRAFEQLSQNKEIALPRKTSSYGLWAQHLQDWYKTEEFQTEQGYWNLLPTQIKGLPVDRQRDGITVETRAQCKIELSKAETEELIKSVQSYRLGVDETVLASLLLALKQWSGNSEYIIDLESHGRVSKDPDISIDRTVGWFTSLYSVHFDLSRFDTVDEVLRSTKLQKGAVPGEGVGLGLMAQFGNRVAAEGEVLFNYLGQFDASFTDSKFQIAKEDIGRSAAEQLSPYKLEFNSLIIEGKLDISCRYDGAIYKSETVENLCKSLNDWIHRVVKHCRSSFGYSTLDFPLASLTEASLNQLTEKFKANIEDVYPLSPMQEGLIFHGLTESDYNIYLTQQQFTLGNDLNVRHFKNAWSQLISRHAILRTAFSVTEQGTFQVVLSDVDLEYTELDWSRETAESKEVLVEELMNEARSSVFEMDKAPLMRLDIIREKHGFRLFWHHHHVLLDGWSGPLVFKEFLEIYQSIAKGRESDLPPVRPYRDYVGWLQEKTQTGMNARKYWQQKMAGYDRPTDLRFRNGLPSARHKEEEFLLETSVSQRLTEFAKKEHLTTNSIVQGAWSLLLSVYSGQDDVVFGVTNSGRQIDLKGVDSMVGLFINTLPMRVSTEGSTVRTFLKGIQQQQQNDNQNAYISLSEIQKYSEVTSGTALFDTLVIFENYPIAEELKNVSNIPFQISGVRTIEYSNYPIMLTIIPGDVLKFNLKYDSGKFNSQEIGAMVEQLFVLIGQLLTNPDTMLEELSIASESQQSLILNEFNNPNLEYDREQTIISLFDEQVKQFGERIALVSGESTLSYKQLNESANQLAWFLKDQYDLQPEEFAGVCLPRNEWMVISILALVKLGVAYVPVELHYPQSRAQFMLENSHCRLNLNEVVLNDFFAVREQYPVTNPEHEVKPRSAAYVIYTSGSTGRPKGVVIEHYNVTRLLKPHHSLFDFTEEDVWTMFHSHCFDVSVWEMYGALLFGGKLVMVDSETAKDTARFIDLIKEHRVTILSQTPSAFYNLNNLLSEQGFDQLDLRYVIFAGEPLKVNSLEGWKKAYPETRLINMYGITETTVHVTYKEITEKEINQNINTVGTALPTLQCYILDKHQRVLPIGVVGELCVAGAGLAREYLDQPDLTNNKFIPNPFGEGRIYRSGDLARWMPDGGLEYIGRADMQLKVRGFRIEPGEIEAHLENHEKVRNAVITALEQDTGTKQLVGYIVGEEDLKFEVLEQHLSGLVPEYMVPHVWVKLDAIPLTNNGKTDKKRLPLPEYQVTSQFATARNTVENKLIKIWQKVLGVKRVGIDDDFFTLGGDSIVSIQIVSLARAEGIGLSPKDLFTHSTIAQLVPIVKEIKHIRAQQGIVTGSAPLAPIQRHFFNSRLRKPNLFNQAVFLKIDRDLSEELLREAFKVLLYQHDALRFNYPVDNDGMASQTYGKMPDHLPFHIEEIADLDKTLQERVAFWDSEIDIVNGPLTRMVLFKCGEQRRLYWNIHHLVVDGVSWRILLEDLKQLCELIRAKKRPILSSKTTSYGEWVSHLYQWIEGPVRNDQRTYWSRVPKHLPELPVDSLAVEISPASHIIKLGNERTDRMLKEIGSYRLGVDEFVIAAWLMALKAWSGLSEFLIDQESHGRMSMDQQIDISRTVGWFTSLYSTYYDVSENSTLDQWIKNVKEQHRSIPDEGIGYGLLNCLEDIELPHGEILFNYLGKFDSILQNPFFDLANEEAQVYQKEPLDVYKLAINGLILDDGLNFYLTYNSGQYEKSSITRLAQLFEESVKKLLRQCEQHFGYTPSDYDLIQVNQAELDILQQDFGDKIEDIYGLSPMQEGVLFHSLIDQDYDVYLIQKDISFQSKGIDLNHLTEAWKHLLNRHPVLRTAFVMLDSGPAQVVLSQGIFELVKHDWSGMSTQERLQLKEDLMLQARSEVFALGKPTLMRIDYIQEGEGSCRLLWHHHHILTDGWSGALLFKEFIGLYSASVKGEEPAVQYVDSYRSFIEWLFHKNRTESEQYWKERLSGFTQPSNLLFGQTGKSSGRYGQIDYHLTDDLSKKLNSFGQLNKFTLNTLIQGAWSVLVSQLSGTEDVIFGVTNSGRHVPLPGVQELVGLLINTIPMRVITRADSVIDLLHEIQDHQQNDSEHVHLGLTNIQKCSGVDPGVGLFETLVIFENYPLQEVDEELPLQVSHSETIDYTNYPLTITVVPEEQVYCKWNYDTGRFTAEEVKMMCDTFTRILEKLAHEAREVNELYQLNNEETEHLVFDLNDTKRELPKAATLVNLIEDQVEISPEACAVTFEDTSLTYRELNERSNQLAHYLISLDLQKEELIPVCMHRSEDLLISICAILKAGAAYVPVDPAYPENRVNYMLRHSGARFMICNNETAGIKAEGLHKAINLDELSALTGKQATENPKVETEPDQLAYVIYTSGSTGQPKGVAVEHGNVVNLLIDMQDRFKPDSGDSLLAVTSVSFDIHVLEMFLPLVSGAGLVIASSPDTRSPEKLMSLINTKKVTIMQATPSTWQLLIEAGWQIDEPLTVLCGGEAMPSDLAAQILSKPTTQALYNMFGPTETTVWSSCTRILSADHITVGVPMSNTSFYVLDESGRLAPAGIPGELYIGGAGVARGYLNEPGLTKDRFRESPFQEGEKLYKTGDMARWTDQGELEFIGRRDEQIKIRGFRVELEEIEHILQQHQDVNRAVVTTREYTGENKQLVAYVMTESSLEKDKLERHCQTHLPDYMVPRLWVEIEEVPLTPNGKVDRRSLPDPDITSKDIVAPRSEAESTMVDIWKQVLQLNAVGINDNFFDLGGDSISAIKIMFQARQQGILLNPGDVFLYQTISELCLASGDTTATDLSEEDIGGAFGLTDLDSSDIDALKDQYGW